ncbi:MAG: hypothetical protein WCI73_00420 [Phycisphaerae bacterium]
MVKDKLGFWAQVARNPFLLAAGVAFTETCSPGWPPVESRHHSGHGYAAILDVLKEIPDSVGFHLCGGDIENKIRKYGLKNCRDQIDRPYTDNITQANGNLDKWTTSFVYIYTYLTTPPDALARKVPMMVLGRLGATGLPLPPDVGIPYVPDAMGSNNGCLFSMQALTGLGPT